MWNFLLRWKFYLTLAVGLLAAFVMPCRAMETDAASVLQSSGEEESDEPATLEDVAEAEDFEEGSGKDPGQQSRSGYDDKKRTAGTTSVEADLFFDNLEKRPVFTLFRQLVDPLYRFKKRVDGTWGIRFSMDYNFLNQYASFSYTERRAASGAFRFYGTWDLFRSKERVHGGLVFRVENRHSAGTAVTPRNLGYDAGSAMSTASFKDFDWGITSLYWSQFFDDRTFALVFGQMDPGDFMDAFPLLSAWTAFMNEAFFNNPAEALPQQGVGFAFRGYLLPNYYVAGGVHDALADADGVNVAELLDGRDLFRWVEVGWSPSKRAAPGDSIHLTYWQQDALEEKGTEQSQGLAFSFAPGIFGDFQPFLRVGYSDGDAAIMRYLWAIGVGTKMGDGDDLLGIGLSYGAPVEAGTHAQMTNEVFYRLQLTDHLQVTPSLQMTFNPSFNDTRDAVFVGSMLRMRLVF